MPNDGILGLGPPSTDIERKHSFVKYLIENDVI
jgi:hypothetical protein